MESILDINDYASTTKRLRKEVLRLTQKQLADTLGVSFPTVNRWENGKAKPSHLVWRKLLELEAEHEPAISRIFQKTASLPVLGFASTSQKVRAAMEVERLSYAHTINPVFATEISRVDPLPHQRIAVYEHMLKQDSLRFLLADDAGAGKTIMCGLYIREMLSRKRIKRIIIIPPAGLVGNWRSELSTLFQIDAEIITGAIIRSGADNPFAAHDIAICSIDTIRKQKSMACLAEAPAYDLAVFDEAHKLSCDQSGDMRVRESERYKVASAIAGADGHKPSSKRLLPWHATHLLLLTATPHMGKDYPYFALWRLLEPQLFSSPQAFKAATDDMRAAHFIRRTKEEMVSLEGKPLYPMRCSSTLSYELTEGERELYDATTDYLVYIYNKAKILNRSASKLALAVFQRRLASSTWALLKSMERRFEKIKSIIEQVEDNRLTEDQLLQLEFCQDDEPFACPMDEAEMGEPDDATESNVLGSMVAGSLKDLYAELDCVSKLVRKAHSVYETGRESKFDMLRSVIESPDYAKEKLLVFTEHKDTLEFLTQRLEALGYAGRIAYIHGGLDFEERHEQISFFRAPDGARVMICTDAAAEGVNLQFCWIMINYDIPWNPARLEQRMGRIHRYGQKHNPVFLLNMVASNTREGKVLTTLLEKLEAIRKQLKSDKVFDSIGRVFSDVSITDWMRQAMLAERNGTGMDAVGRELDGVLTEGQILAIEAQEKSIYGTGGEVKRELPRMKGDMDNEYLRHLLPGYTQVWLLNAAPLLGLSIEGNVESTFRLHACSEDEGIEHSALWDAINGQARAGNPWLSLSREKTPADGIWIHPGESVFEALRDAAWKNLHGDAISGAVFYDAEASEPCILEIARVSVVRKNSAQTNTLEEKLVCVQYADGEAITTCPVEKILVLSDAEDVIYTPAARRLAGAAREIRENLDEFLRQMSADMANQTADSERKILPLKKKQLCQSMEYEASALAARISELRGQINRGDVDESLQEEMLEKRKLLSGARSRRQSLLDKLDSSVADIGPGEVETIGFALVLPDKRLESEMHTRELDPELLCPPIEAVAMRVAMAWEGQDCDVTAVHTPARARLANLPDYPGYDLLSFDKMTGVRKCIEVKGTGVDGDISMSVNEYARAATLGDEYWLYCVFGCATNQPRLVRVQNPFKKLLMRSSTSTTVRWSITMKQILEQGEK